MWANIMPIVNFKGETNIDNCSPVEENFRFLQEDGEEYSFPPLMENEKRMRREIANSNERRRMQSINAGFQSLKNLLPHHEGEKLSKAAILQQTAEYVYGLEQERTQLLSQNCQLKRLLDQTENSTNGGDIQISKKRKFDNLLQTISDSSDEGLGSMSPEPVTIFAVVTKHPNGNAVATATSAFTPKEFVDMKHQLEIERQARLNLEEQLRQLKGQLYPEKVSDVTIRYQHQEVIEHTDNIREDITSLVNESFEKLPNKNITHSNTMQLLIEPIPPQKLVCSPEVHDDDGEDDERTMTPNDNIEEVKLESVIELPSARLQPILEAAIKAEPKVEVERINSPAALSTVIVSENGKNIASDTQARMYVTSTSRQNLETIVEAIRHLEGDPLFGEITEPQDLSTAKPANNKLQVDMNSFLQFHSNSSHSTSSKLSIKNSNPEQCRPGVIVNKKTS